MAPQKLTPEQMQIIRTVEAQHPAQWTKGTWYPADMNGRPVEIKRTRSTGIPYLKIRKRITVHLKDPQGNVISSRAEFEYYTVNLHAGTVNYQGW